ncbi:hypothetical protein BJ508DRAFT_69480 [Ascobolus immersus RN42]|uniref:Uncharacterized protein n=1 Tax=Ascobolus immersus RN42 TaxID=1160509 RepID=A0A3N4ICS4_ASCIM|nr:hypothetical protein BJ508DRAFT_69480 [Ascobolus immersus RN42]
MLTPSASSTGLSALHKTTSAASSSSTKGPSPSPVPSPAFPIPTAPLPTPSARRKPSLKFSLSGSFPSSSANTPHDFPSVIHPTPPLQSPFDASSPGEGGDRGVTSYFSLPVRGASSRKAAKAAAKEQAAAQAAQLQQLQAAQAQHLQQPHLAPARPLTSQKSFDSSSYLINGGVPGGSSSGGKMFASSGKNASAGAAYGPGPQSPHIHYETVHDVATKRIATLDYLRRAHEGRVYWFNTVFFSKQDLTKTIYHDSRKLGRRAANYFILGISIPNILDVSTSPLEYLKAFNLLLTEFESYLSAHPSDASAVLSSHTSSSSSRRLPKLFSRSSSSKPRRGSSAAVTANAWSASEITLVNSDTLERARSSSGGAGTISGPMPISDPDGSGILSPPFIQHIPTSMPTAPSLAGTGLGTPGLDNDYTFLSTPHLPFEPDFFETLTTLCDVLIDAYSRVLQLVTAPDHCNAAVAEMFHKADAKVRKCVVGTVVKEFEDAARGPGGIRGEMMNVGKMVLGNLL